MVLKSKAPWIGMSPERKGAERSSGTFEAQRSRNCKMMRYVVLPGQGRGGEERDARDRQARSFASLSKDSFDAGTRALSATRAIVASSLKWKVLATL